MSYLEKGSDLSWQKFYIELATYRVKEKDNYDNWRRLEELIKEYDEMAEKEGKAPYNPKDSEYIWKQNGKPEYLTRDMQEAYDHWFKDENYRESLRACEIKREEKTTSEKSIIPPKEERNSHYKYDKFGVVVGRTDEDSHDIYGVPLDNSKDNSKFTDYKRNSSR